MLGRRFAAALSLVAVLSVLGGAPAMAAPPATNDAFGNAKVIAPGALPYVDEVDVSAATVQGAENDSECGGDPDRSIWYRITPTTTAYLRADTFGSRAEGDLTIYRGTNLATVVEVACNSYATQSTDLSRVAFRAVAGMRYYIRVTGSEDYTVLHLRHATPPANDDFANAITVASLPFDHLTNNVDATLQGGEPDPATAFDGCAETGSTIWYRITPASAMTIRVDTFLSGIDTWVAVHRGTALGSLAPVVCNDDTSGIGSGYQSNVAWKAAAGQTYYVQVGGYAGETSDIGVRLAKVNAPPNDDFGSPTTIPGNGALRQLETTRNATWQGTEPTPNAVDCAGAVTYASVWYSFTSPDELFYIADTFGSTYRTVIAVYTGSTLGGLTLVGCGDGDGASVHFAASTGVTYRIQISGAYGGSGSLHVHVQPD